ncbi:MAG: hypothetical protein Q8O88_02115 [bacterium]|nr:hypothetical protein [bacterium]
MQTQISETIKGALDWTRTIDFTWKKGAIEDIKQLLIMVNSGQVSVSNGDKAVLIAVAMLGDWEDELNRTTTVILTDKFNTDSFIGRMGRAIEKVEIVC